MSNMRGVWRPQLKLWINEKMLTAQDMSYDEARNLHSKWQKHQAFMAELASNKDWLDKIDKVGWSYDTLYYVEHLTGGYMILCTM